MIKKYFYALDDYNRFTEMYEATEENEEALSYLLSGEFEDAIIENLILNEDGLVNGEIVKIGQAEEEIERDNIFNLRSELEEINIWLQENDWKVNKIVIGEWEVTDPRWIDYLSERANKRERQDELNFLLAQ